MKPLLSVRQLTKHFAHNGKTIKAVNGVDFDIFPGETLGLVGESGCGKSTIGRCILRMVDPFTGSISFDGKSITNFNKEELKAFRRETAMIFQDPNSSLNPRMTIGDIIAEPLIVHQLMTSTERKQRVLQLLDMVGLPKDAIQRFPHEFSGGQKQRVGIARALACNPRFVICDEPLSALDVSVQAQIINLLKELQNEMGLTYLFIAHDLRIVKYLSTRVAVMYLGNIVETAPSQELYDNPLHPYTQALLSAIPIPNPDLEKKRQRIILKGEVPSPSDPPKGCPFVTRCPNATTTCHHFPPHSRKMAPDHFASCHLLKDKNEESKKPLAETHTES